MKDKVLFVDDEQQILDTFRASLRKRYAVDTALGPEEGLEKVTSSGPYAVVVSDLKMPKMDGITFLSKVQQASPDTVRVMLTGHADLESAIEAVNKGSVFRFLTKPSPIDEMIRTLDVALKQYALVVSEKELLRGTLRGSVKMLTDMLALVNPEAFGRSERIKRLAMFVGKELRLKNLLYLELASMLCQVGCVMVPDNVLEKLFSGEELTSEEQQIYDMHPSVTASLLANIPRMNRVSTIITHQNERFSENPQQLMEARILKASLDYDDLVQSGKDKHTAFEVMRTREGWYDEGVLDTLERGAARDDGYIRRDIALGKLEPGMILDDALWSKDEVHIMAKGTELSRPALLRLENFMKTKRLPPSVRVLVPID
ncbi:HD domain-containing phosphohydrolase [Desulfobaculum sp. SPO524]|uniref:HD domain-containing phosphohydrolase n=1 Tax=Desulfobaculum sp. SPO524 TaxID=3378071 RepID=UPI003853A8A6